MVNHVVDPANLDITGAQGQRGALSLASGLVYITYGGRAGDCFSTNGHTYYGIVLAARRTDGAVLYRFQTNGTGAVWASGGASLDSTNHVYVSIGNGQPPDSERVFKLNPNLSRQNSWVPANQDALDSADADVGSIIPQLVGGGDVFQAGKMGDAYLLSSTLKQQQGPTHVCTGTSSDASFGAAAYLSPYIYVPCSTGLFVLKQTGNTFAPAWSKTGVDASPPILAGGNVMFLDFGANTLYVLNAVTGAPVTTASVGGTTHFATPATGNGFVYVPAQGEIDAFALTGCASADMSPDLLEPRVAGTTITFTATSTGCSGTPEYKFFLQAPGGPWNAYTSFGGATWAWPTTGFGPGVYGVGVWVRATGSASQYESYWVGTYTLTGTFCTSATPSTVTTPPAAPGTTVTWTGNATGCGTPSYRFFLLSPGSSTWVMKQAYSTSPWVWDTTGLPAGTYQIGVWARDSFSARPYDSYGYATFRLGSGNCTSAGLGTSAGSPQPPGMAITVTGTSNSCSSPLYQFLLLPPGGTWTVTQSFGAGATWNWNTPTTPGYYQLGVWVKEAASSAKYDAYAIIVFQVVPVTCTSATIAGAPASPQTQGTSITFTATSTGCGTPRYEFWELVPPSTTWSIVQPYGSGNTWTWDSTGAHGPYRFGVWARQNGSTNSYDTYGQTTFWIGS